MACRSTPLPPLMLPLSLLLSPNVHIHFHCTALYCTAVVKVIQHYTQQVTQPGRPAAATGWASARPSPSPSPSTSPLHGSSLPPHPASLLPLRLGEPSCGGGGGGGGTFASGSLGRSSLGLGGGGGGGGGGPSPGGIATVHDVQQTLLDLQARIDRTH